MEEQKKPSPVKIIVAILSILSSVIVYRILGTEYYPRTASNRDEYSTVYYFEDVSAAYVGNEAVISGRLNSSVFSYNTTLTYYVMDDDGKVVFTSKEDVGILTPFSPHEFNTTVSSQRYAIQAVGGYFEVRANGRVVGNS